MCILANATSVSVTNVLSFCNYVLKISECKLTLKWDLSNMYTVGVSNVFKFCIFSWNRCTKLPLICTSISGNVYSIKILIDYMEIKIWNFLLWLNIWCKNTLLSSVHETSLIMRQKIIFLQRQSMAVKFILTLNILYIIYNFIPSLLFFVITLTSFVCINIY